MAEVARQIHKNQAKHANENLKKKTENLKNYIHIKINTQNINHPVKKTDMQNEIQHSNLKVTCMSS